jgi:hypothetical protein
MSAFRILVELGTLGTKASHCLLQTCVHLKSAEKKLNTSLVVAYLGVLTQLRLDARQTCGKKGNWV